MDECNVNNFTVTSFPEITEVPDDFLIEVKRNQQMNYEELGQYVKYLQERRFRHGRSCRCSITRSSRFRCSR